MKKSPNSRVLAFIEFVKETEPEEVAKEFMKLSKDCPDVNSANLSVLLEHAKTESPDAETRAKLERSMFNSALHHCKS
jgi:hypothetical protein